MKYKNISGGIIPLLSSQIAINGIVELSDKDIQTMEVKPYIGKYLKVAEGTPDSVFQQPVVEKTKEDGVRFLGKDPVVKAPKIKTEEELEEEKQQEEDQQTIGIKKAEITIDGSVVQTVAEVLKGDVRKVNDTIKKTVSWQKRIEYIESIKNKVLLEVVINGFKKGKVFDALQKRINTLS